MLADLADQSSLRNKEIANALASAARPLQPHKIVTIQSDLDEPKGASKLSKAPTSRISRSRVLRSRRRQSAAAQEETLQEHVKAKLSKRLSRSPSAKTATGGVPLGVTLGATLASKKKSKKRSREQFESSGAGGVAAVLRERSGGVENRNLSSGRKKLSFLVKEEGRSRVVSEVRGRKKQKLEFAGDQVARVGQVAGVLRKKNAR